MRGRAQHHPRAVRPYNGPLYQVQRPSDSTTLDIGVVAPVASPLPDAGGYANAAAQDSFCANTICVITSSTTSPARATTSPRRRPGGVPRPGEGRIRQPADADTAPITIGGHKAYGVYITPGTGYRNNDTTGIAIGDQPEGIYAVVDGTHYNGGCCFDYGNAETNSRDDGTGTMETIYFGTNKAWGTGQRHRPVDHGRPGGRPVLRIQREQNAADPTIEPGGS